MSSHPPVHSLRPMGPRVLVRRYERPEQIKGIWIPDQHRFDPTLSLWEVIRSTPKANEQLGYELELDDIVFTRPRAGIMLNELIPHHPEGHLVAFMPASQIIKAIRWREEADEDADVDSFQ